MTLQEAREEVIKRGIELLEKDDSDKRLICPICRCGSDEGEKVLSSQDKIHFTCPLGCFSDADIIGIIGIKTNTNNEDNIQLQKLRMLDWGSFPGEGNPFLLEFLLRIIFFNISSYLRILFIFFLNCFFLKELSFPQMKENFFIMSSKKG